MARLGSLLTRGDWVYLAGLLVPLFVYNVVLKVIRILTRPDAPGPLEFVDQVRSDLLFNLGFVALWVGIFAVARSGRPRVVALVLLHVSVVLVIALTTSAHFFYQKTGSTLDWSFVVVSVASLGEIRGVLASETTALQWTLVVVALLATILVPSAVTRLATGAWHPPIKSAIRPRMSPLTVGVTALVLFSLSLVPSLTDAGNAFSRDPVANMVINELVTPSVEVKVSPEQLPTDTTFVPTDGTKERNVVVVFLESTRARSTTPYNKGLNTTPFLDEVSKESLMAERAYAVVPHTSKALVASLCGVVPPLDTRKTESEPGIIPARCLPDLLGDHGYRTAFFQAATETFERRPQLADNLGYDDFYAVEDMDETGFDEVNYFGYEDDIMLEPSEAWLEARGDEPFLATYLTVTPHHDYVVPDRYGTRKFSNDEVLNRYLNTVRYQDFFLRNLFDQYKALGLYEDTIFVVFGDHGEGFEEHGLKQHDNTIYEEGLRIPFLIHDPRRPEGGRIKAPVNQLDVLPTVADLLGYRIGGGAYPGTSMLSAPGDRVLMASCYHEQTCVASIDGHEKYVYSYGNRGEEFYDLSKDPGERRNLIERQGEKKIEALRHDLLVWEARANASFELQRRRAEATSSD